MTCRVLVTEADGYIGHHLVRYLWERASWVKGVEAPNPEFTPLAADEFEMRRLDRAKVAYDTGRRRTQRTITRRPLTAPRASIPTSSSNRARASVDWVHRYVRLLRRKAAAG